MKSWKPSLVPRQLVTWNLSDADDALGHYYSHTSDKFSQFLPRHGTPRSSSLLNGLGT